ncbi:MAG TPA: AMIN domain-containing protein, partial [Candidatus Aminicenantes bacterium]|nr:AMIN domain-containing protein [Candidatus Aminicenantes bacterium]
MKGKKYLHAAAFLCIITLVSGYPVYSQQLSNSLYLQNELNSTRLTLKSETPFNVIHSFYSTGPDSRIVLELDMLPSDLNLQADLSNSTLIRDIQAVHRETTKPIILIDLNQKMPYTVFNKGKSVVIEINQAQAHLENYPLTEENRKKIQKGMGSSVYLRDIKVSEGDQKIDIKAEVPDSSVPNVFVLENPLRLVVDLHNTLTAKSSFSRSINKYGIIELRTGQFQVSNPYTISRMVFDLKEPVFYTLDQEKDSLNISFYKNQEFTLAEPAPEEPPVSETLEEEPSSKNGSPQDSVPKAEENHAEKNHT